MLLLYPVELRAHKSATSEFTCAARPDERDRILIVDETGDGVRIESFPAAEKIEFDEEGEAGDRSLRGMRQPRQNGLTNFFARISSAVSSRNLPTFIEG